MTRRTSRTARGVPPGTGRHRSELKARDEVSRSGEFHPQALAEPYVNVSAHTAPSIRPPGRRPSEGILQHLTLLLGHPIFTLSVLLFTVFVALTFGFQAAMFTGCACYFLAALASRSAFAAELGLTL